MLEFRKPTMGDGLAVYQLIERCPPLDLNSAYYYFIMTRDFSSQSVLVWDSDLDAPVGYVSGYIRPHEPDTLFIWQVAVDGRARGQGLAGRMLQWICDGLPDTVRFLETTISPSNTASRAVFEKFARSRQVKLSRSEFLTKEAFGPLGHEQEDAYRMPLRE